MTSTGQGLLGNNMFAYCLNAPTLFADPSGLCTYVAYHPWLGLTMQYVDCGKFTCPQSSAFRYYASSTQTADSYGAYVGASAATFFNDWYYGVEGYGDFEGTMAMGFSYINTSQTGGGGSVALCIDGQGNVGIVASGTLAVGTPAKGCSMFASITDAPSIEDLNGASAQIGGSVPFVGAEAVYFQGATSGKDHTGMTLSWDILALLGKSKPTIAEAHLSASYSKVFDICNVRN